MALSWYVSRQPGRSGSHAAIDQERTRVARFEPLEGRRLLAPVNVFTDPLGPVASEQGPTPTVFRFERSGPVDEPLTVSFGYVGGTAQPGIDFRVLEQASSFGPGAAAAYTSVLPVNDALNEPTETIRLAIVPDPACDIGLSGVVAVPFLNAFALVVPGVFDALGAVTPAALTYLDVVVAAGQLGAQLGLSGATGMPPRVEPVNKLGSAYRQASHFIPWRRSRNGVKWLDRVGRRWSVSQRAVRANGVVVPPPALDEDFRLQQRVELLAGQQLVAELAVEALDVAVLPQGTYCAERPALAIQRLSLMRFLVIRGRPTRRRNDQVVASTPRNAAARSRSNRRSRSPPVTSGETPPDARR